MRNYGLCSLSIVPVRAEPSDRSELITQLIFGDLYERLEISEDKKWVKIKIESDGYKGWIDFKQSNHIPEIDYELLKKSDRLKTENPVTKVIHNETELLLVTGSSFYINPLDENSLYGGYQVLEQLKDLNQKKT